MDFLDEIEQFHESFSSEEQAVMRLVFQRLLDGRGTRLETVATTLGMPLEVVETAVGQLVERGTMERDPVTREIVAARGLSLTDTPHRLSVNGRQLYAFCAVDAVGIPAALGTDARIASRCHACGTPVSLTMTGGAVTEASPGTVIWAAERDLTRSLRRYT